jgi:hypothetical protein
VYATTSGKQSSGVIHAEAGGYYEAQVLPATGFAGDKSYEYSMETYMAAPGGVKGSYTYGGLWTNVADFAVEGEYAYIIGGAGLEIVKIGNPPNPRKVAGLILLATGKGIAVKDGYAYIANGLLGLTVVDVHTPTNPKVVGNEWLAGIARDVAVAGNRAYVTTGPFGVQTIDISNPADPKWLDNDDSDGHAEKIAAGGGLVAVTTNTKKVQFYRAKNENNKLHKFATFNNGSNVEQMAQFGYRLHATAKGKTTVLDLSDLNTVKNLGSYSGNTQTSYAAWGKYAINTNGRKLEIREFVRK